MSWGCAGVYRAPQTTPAPPESGPPPGVVHVVEPGQTLWRIARAYGVSLDTLAAANGIGDPSRLEVGRAVLVPGAPEVLQVAPWPAPLDSTVVAPAARATAAFVWPLSGGRVLSGFGEPRRTHTHAGLDITGDRGQRIVAAASGHVIYSDNRMSGYGNTVILDHGAGFQSLYAHNSRLLVRVGDRVQQGQPIAVMGRSGNATAEHCHFEIRKARVPVDPMLYLSGELR